LWAAGTCGLERLWIGKAAHRTKNGSVFENTADLMALQAGEPLQKLIGAGTGTRAPRNT